MSTAASHIAVTAPSLTTFTPAKINLTLEVSGARPDGYHELRSVVVGAGLYDRVSCRVSEVVGIETACSDRLLEGPDNLAKRAAMALARYAGREPALTINIEKHIPVGAGLGGGSSDAAATLRLCDALWGTGLDSAVLAAVGAEVGSDVPLFFSLPGAMITGRGERAVPVAMRWSGWILLAFVGQGVSTARVYSAWRPSDGRGARSDLEQAVQEAATADELNALLSNHLEPAVFRVSPSVARAYEELNRMGLGAFRIAGAGSTLYRVFDEKEAACRAAGRIERLPLGISTLVAAAPVGPGSIVSEEC